MMVLVVEGVVVMAGAVVLGVEGEIVMAVTVEVPAVAEATMTVEAAETMAAAEAADTAAMTTTATEMEVVEVTADVVLMKGVAAAIENEMVAALASLHPPLFGAPLAMLAVYIPQHLLNGKQEFSLVSCQATH